MTERARAAASTVPGVRMSAPASRLPKTDSVWLMFTRLVFLVFLVWLVFLANSAPRTNLADGSVLDLVDGGVLDSAHAADCTQSEHGVEACWSDIRFPPSRSADLVWIWHGFGMNLAPGSAAFTCRPLS